MKDTYKQKKWLRANYVVRRKTMKTIAAESGVSVTTILYFMRKFGIARRNPGSNVIVHGAVGKQFARWTLLKLIRPASRLGRERWLAKCHCGTTKEIDIRGAGPKRHSNSCGHCFKPVYPKAKQGDRLHDWTLLKYIGNGKWRASCKCGKRSSISLHAIRRGRSGSCVKCAAARRRGMRYNTAPPTIKKNCAICKKTFLCRTGNQYLYCTERCRRRARHAVLAIPGKRLWALAKAALRRAAAAGIPFDDNLPRILSEAPVTVCACCKSDLEYVEGRGVHGKRSERGPSLDRIVAAKGYIPSNVAIICFRCNALKRDASRDELQKIVEYIDSHQARTRR